MKKNAFKEFVKEHKVEIALGALTIVGAAIGVSLCSRHGTTVKSDYNISLDLTSMMKQKTKLPIPELSNGDIADICDYGETVEAWCDNIPITDLGEFGSKLLEYAKEYNVAPINENSKLWMLIDIRS